MPRIRAPKARRILTEKRLADRHCDEPTAEAEKYRTAAQRINRWDRRPR